MVVAHLWFGELSIAMNSSLTALLSGDYQPSTVLVVPTYDLSFLHRKFAQVIRHYEVYRMTEPQAIVEAIRQWDFRLSKYHTSLISFTLLELYIMERKKRDAKPKVVESKPVQTPFKGFINISLTDEDKALLMDTDPYAAIGEFIEDILDFGKMSVSYDGKSYNCACVIKEGDWAGYCISSFADAPLFAVMVTAYKLRTYGTRLGDFATRDANKPSFG